MHDAIPCLDVTPRVLTMRSICLSVRHLHYVALRLSVLRCEVNWCVAGFSNQHLQRLQRDAAALGLPPQAGGLHPLLQPQRL